MEPNHTDVAIIGAGLTGLTLAYRLAGQCDFVVLEQSDRPGGVIQTASERGFRYEMGPNSGTVANWETATLLDELEGVQLANGAAKKRYILKKGAWRPLPRGPLSALGTSLFSLGDKLRILGEPWRKRGTDPDESVAAFVKRRLGQSFLDYAIDPFISGVYAGRPDQLILRHAFPVMYDMEQTQGSLIRGAIARKRAAKRSTTKAPSRKIFSFEKGLGQLVDQLYQKAGTDHFKFRTRVISIALEGKRFLIKYQTDRGAGTLVANRVVTTVPAFALSSLLTFAQKDATKSFNALPYAPVIEVAVGFDQWSGTPLDGFGGLVPAREGEQILGILFMNALFPKRAPEGGALLSVFLGGMRNRDVLHWSDDKIREVVADAIKRLLKQPGFEPDLFKIMRYNQAIPQYTEVMDEIHKAITELETNYPGLYIAGQVTGGIGIPNRIKQGTELADRINK